MADAADALEGATQMVQQLLRRLLDGQVKESAGVDQTNGHRMDQSGIPAEEPIRTGSKFYLKASSGLIAIRQGCQVILRFSLLSFTFKAKKYC